MLENTDDIYRGVKYAARALNIKKIIIGIEANKPKSIVNKSVNKVFIIQSVDRKLPLEDIADAKGMEMEDLLSEIEAIVYSGTKLNLNYYIEQTLDDDVVDEIYDYFRNEAESDALEVVMEDLRDDYDEFEVRLVRIKFLCEVAN